MTIINVDIVNAFVPQVSINFPKSQEEIIKAIIDENSGVQPLFIEPDFFINSLVGGKFDHVLFKDYFVDKILAFAKEYHSEVINKYISNIFIKNMDKSIGRKKMVKVVSECNSRLFDIIVNSLSSSVDENDTKLMETIYDVSACFASIFTLIKDKGLAQLTDSISKTIEKCIKNKIESGCVIDVLHLIEYNHNTPFARGEKFIRDEENMAIYFLSHMNEQNESLYSKYIDEMSNNRLQNLIFMLKKVECYSTINKKLLSIASDPNFKRIKLMGAY